MLIDSDWLVRRATLTSPAQSATGEREQRQSRSNTYKVVTTDVQRAIQSQRTATSVTPNNPLRDSTMGGKQDSILVAFTLRLHAPAATKKTATTRVSPENAWLVTLAGSRVHLITSSPVSN
jgi:hypothetical protein